MADNRVITTKKARPSLGNSPQAKWMRKKQAAGKCRACGKDRPPELKQNCRECQNKVNAYIKVWRSKRREAAKAQQSNNSEPASSVPQSEPSGGTPETGPKNDS